MRKGLRLKEGSPAAGRADPLRVLFVCSRNRRRSPTTEAVFSDRAELEVASAGLAPNPTQRMLKGIDRASLEVNITPVFGLPDQTMRSPGSV